jgi:hypothetical protein
MGVWVKLRVSGVACGLLMDLWRLWFISFYDVSGVSFLCLCFMGFRVQYASSVYGISE